MLVLMKLQRGIDQTNQAVAFLVIPKDEGRAPCLMTVLPGLQRCLLGQVAARAIAAFHADNHSPRDGLCTVAPLSVSVMSARRPKQEKET